MHSNYSDDFSECLTEHTGWRRLIGCLKLQVIFRKRATNHRALLQKINYEDKAPYASTSPCTRCSSPPSALHEVLVLAASSRHIHPTSFLPAPRRGNARDAVFHVHPTSSLPAHERAMLEMLGSSHHPGICQGGERIPADRQSRDTCSSRERVSNFCTDKLQQ